MCRYTIAFLERPGEEKEQLEKLFFLLHASTWYCIVWWVTVHIKGGLMLPLIVRHPWVILLFL
jgi:hypothetical protein